jgi:hypothetical protein
MNRGIVQGFGIEPTMHILYENDLRLIAFSKNIFKYADETNVLIPEITDLCLANEF